LQQNEFEPDGVVLNPVDYWTNIALLKTSGSGADGRYLYSDPRTATMPNVWSLPIVVTNSIAAGQFLVGAFSQSAAIWDRANATIEVSREHSDYFVKNMIAILCEERLALTVFKPLGLIYGGFPFGS